MVAKTWIFTGGRNWVSFKRATTVTARLVGEHDKVVVGCARGLDACIRSAYSRADVYKADWDKYGKAAGAIRNKEMLVSNPGGIVIAFPGGKGTENMVRQARARGHVVLRVEL